MSDIRVVETQFKEAKEKFREVYGKLPINLRELAYLAQDGILFKTYSVGISPESVGQYVRFIEILEKLEAK